MAVVWCSTLHDAWQASSAQEIRRYKNQKCQIRCEHFLIRHVRQGVRRAAQASFKKTTLSILMAVSILDVIMPNLFLGSMREGRNLDALTYQGVTRILLPSYRSTLFYAPSFFYHMFHSITLSIRITHCYLCYHYLCINNDIMLLSSYIVVCGCLIWRDTIE